VLASDGEEAWAKICQEIPDVILLDLMMPKMDGFTATRKIMETTPIPIIIVSGSTSTTEVSTTFHAIEVGALAVVQRPSGINHPDHDSSVKELINTVKLMSEIKVVKRWEKVSAKPIDTIIKEKGINKEPYEIKIIGLGASTGGPLVLKTILSGLEPDFPIPLLIVQHIAAGFIEGFAEWLSRESNFPVIVASDKKKLFPGNAYVAPDGFNMGVISSDQIILVNDILKNSHCPSVSYLFQSIAEVYGRNSIGVILTGMGKDGSNELKLIKDKGGITIAQNEESSIVFGMPGEAIKLNAADYILAPEEISAMLMRLVKNVVKY
jgi:two-component system chemotaxis response regulator CheB